MTTEPTTPGLDDVTRDALTDELFSGLQTIEPNAHHCFCGGDAALIDAVNNVRNQLADRDLGDDEPGDDR